MLQLATPVGLLGKAGLHMCQALLQLRSHRSVHGLQVCHILLPLKHLHKNVSVNGYSEASRNLQFRSKRRPPPTDLIHVGRAVCDMAEDACKKPHCSSSMPRPTFTQPSWPVSWACPLHIAYNHDGPRMS